MRFLERFRSAPAPVQRAPIYPADEQSAAAGYSIGMVNLVLARRLMSDNTAMFIEPDELRAVGSRVLVVSGTPETGIRLELADYFDPRFGDRS